MFKRTLFSISFLVLSLFLIPSMMRANHLAGGYIEYDCISEGSYAVTLNIFQDCLDDLVNETQSIRVVPSCNFNFFSTALALSSNEVLTELCPSELGNALCDGGVLQSYRLLKYTGIINIDTECESFRMLFKFNYRTNSVNLANDLWTFYVHTVVYPQAGVCNSSPRYAAPDISQSCVGNGDQIFMSPYDPEGDSLHFSLVSCLHSPAGNSFATIPYAAGYSPEAPMPGASLNENTGLFQYGDAGPGKYAIAIQMDQYDSTGMLMCEVHMDFLIVKELCATAGLTLGEDEVFNLTPGVSKTDPRALSICQGQYFCAEYVYALDDPSINVTSVDNLAEFLTDVEVTWTTEEDSLRLRFCGTSPMSQADLTLTFQLHDDHCPYVNYLITEIEVNVSEATSPAVFIDSFGDELYMTTPTPGETYQWYENGIPIPGATASSLILIDSLGNDYNLIVIDVSGCIGISNTISFGVSSVSEIAFNSIHIAPNPSQDYISLINEKGINWPILIDVYDRQGRRLSSGRLSHYPMKLDIRELESGIYILRVTDADLNVFRASFIKE